MIAPMNNPASDPWWPALWRRWRTQTLLKVSVITVCISAFMAGYFVLLQQPQFAVRVVPVLAADHWFPMVPWAFWPYASLWLYIGITPMLLPEGVQRRRFLLAAALVALGGYAFFFFFPTIIAPVDIDWSPWPLLAFLKSTDAAGNACPSLHVAFSVLTMRWLTPVLRRTGAPAWAHALNLGWGLVIVWSTLATRQHVLLDVFAGAALALAVSAVVQRLPLGGRAEIGVSAQRASGARAQA